VKRDGGCKFVNLKTGSGGCKRSSLWMLRNNTMKQVRITYTGAFHHVMNREYDGNDIFAGKKWQLLTG